MRIAYHPRYNIGFFGVERFHPFDSKKYGRAWKRLHREFGSDLLRVQIPVLRPVSRSDLLLVHSAAYLDSLRSSKTISKALELAMVRYLPALLVNRQVLRPMRMAVQGSVLAAAAALDCGLAVNLSGGYHHAKPDTGEGFCIYSDIALCVAKLRQENRLAMTDRVAYIDLDAHQGNGVCYQFQNDSSVFIFDMYNSWTYPAQDQEARDRIDCDLPLLPGVKGSDYLRTLRDKLPGFLDSVAQSQRIGLVIYNAGTDVFVEDQLGGLSLTAEDVLTRDLFVINEVRQRNIPAVMLLSGGYSAKSFELVATSVSALLKQFGFSAC